MSKKILVTKKGDNSEVNVWLDGTHYRKRENVQEIYRAAQNYKTTGADKDLGILEGLLNPKGTLARRLFDGQFHEEGGKVFLEGTGVPVPEFLVKTMREYEANGWPLLPLVNFWTLCLLNPNKSAQESFYEYCHRYGIVITDFGYAVLYKAVKHKRKVVENKDLARFVAEGIMLAKQKKKGAGTFTVFKTSEGSYRMAQNSDPKEGEEVKGNLKDLHDRLDELDKEEVTLYTDKHTGKMDVYLGVPVKMDRSQCDSDIRVECSRGLHCGSYEYVKKYSNPGDTILVVLVNPMNVVAVPHLNDMGTGYYAKIRVCEYFPRAVMIGGESGEWKELESPYFEDDYLGNEIRLLKDRAHSAAPEEERVVVETRLINVKKEVGTKPLQAQEAIEVFEEEVEEGVYEVRLLSTPAGLEEKGEIKVEDGEKFFQIYLLDPGRNQIAVIKEVRAMTGLGLREAKQMVDKKEVLILDHVPDKKTAEKCVQQLLDAGAKAEIR